MTKEKQIASLEEANFILINYLMDNVVDASKDMEELCQVRELTNGVLESMKAET